MVGVGPVGAGELASSNHLVTYTVDVVEQVVLNATHSGNHVNEVQEDLDLGVAASRVASTSAVRRAPRTATVTVTVTAT